MHRFAPVALATILAATVPAPLRAQAPTPFTVPPATGKFTDPANLAGERVRPRDGRELPIDGGIGPDGKPDNALGLAQMLRKLSTRASLMLIVAHPDDEDGGMLTFYSRGLGARVAVLTLTRGEGGQNAATGDFEDALGLLRTQELLSADRYMGVDSQMFGTEVDFGFSKTKAEAFQKWNHERVLYDAVRAVRIFRPLVIAAVFSGAVTDGHGQHQVSGQIAQEVFKAAGDPNVFPELTKEGILPWQPLKVYARVPFSRVTAQGLYDYATGQTVPAEFTNYVTGQKFTTEPTADVTINEGATDPLLSTCAANLADLPPELFFDVIPSRSGGICFSFAATDCAPLSYVQFARIGLGLQRSQIGSGMRVPPAGRFDVGYHLYGSRVCAPNLPNPTPNLCTVHATTAANSNDSVNSRESGWPTLSRSERVGYRAPREETPVASTMPVSFTTSKGPTGTAAKAPTARSITAQGAPGSPASIRSLGWKAPGNESDEQPSAEGATYNPALANQPTFFDGIDTSWTGIASLDPDDLDPVKMIEIQRHAQNAAAGYPAHSDRIAPELATTLKYLDEEIASITSRPNPTVARANLLHELRIKHAQLEQALTLSLGLSLDATTDRPDLALGESEQVALTLSDTAPEPVAVTFNGISGGHGDHQPPQTAPQLSPGHPLVRTWPINAAPDASFLVTRPYFYRNYYRDNDPPVYQLWYPRFRNAAETPWPYSAVVTVSYQGTTIQLERIVHSGPQPVSIVPPVSIAFNSHASVAFPNTIFTSTVEVENTSDKPLDGTLSLAAPAAWSLAPQQSDLTALAPSNPFTTPFHVTVRDDMSFASSLGGISRVGASVHIAGDNRQNYTEGFRAVGYGTLPRTNFYTPAADRIVPVDLKLPPPNKRRIAYLPGTGDDVPAALASIGLTPTILKVSDLTPDKLKAFDTVILGVRTYNAHPNLHGAPTQALFDFARNGGNVVVQTQTPEFTAADAPYPLVDRNERVVDETTPVQILDPTSPLLTTPNKITSADFNGWIEERGHGFLDSWDPHYTALTETADPGAPAEHILPQAPQRGGLITVQLGKGRWTYVAFALYRQLPEAVPGAFRLFVNLLNP